MPPTPTSTVGTPDSLALSADSPNPPHFGDKIAFDVVHEAGEQPFVNVTCYDPDDGHLIMNTWQAYFVGGLGDGIFALYSPVWREGPAHAVAEVGFYGKNGKKYKTTAKIEFDVEAN